MYIDNSNNQLIITVPRGENIGSTVLKELKEHNITQRTFKTINVRRDIETKTNIVTLEPKQQLYL